MALNGAAGEFNRPPVRTLPAIASYLATNGLDGERIFRGAVAYKTANENVASSIALQADDHLTLTLAASAIYRIQGMVFIATANAAEGFRCALGGTVVVTSMKVQAMRYEAGVLDGDARFAALNSEFTGAMAAGNHFMTLDGSIETSTAGTFLLQWAQNVSGANNTTVQRGSYLAATRLA